VCQTFWRAGTSTALPSRAIPSLTTSALSLVWRHRWPRLPFTPTTALAVQAALVELFAAGLEASVWARLRTDSAEPAEALVDGIRSSLESVHWPDCPERSLALALVTDDPGVLSDCASSSAAAAEVVSVRLLRAVQS
jgi:hypothetical protein